jgi:hypothetical protein
MDVGFESRIVSWQQKKPRLHGAFFFHHQPTTNTQPPIELSTL